jgi:hypothetical protein
MNAPTKQAPALLFENAAGRVLADPAGFLRLVWSANPRHLTDTQAILRAASQHLRQRGWSRLLGDQTHLAPFSPEEQHWISQEWLPSDARASGYRHGAILVSSQVLSRLATAYITSGQPASDTRYRSFDDEATAVDWLLRQPA